MTFKFDIMSSYSYSTSQTVLITALAYLCYAVASRLVFHPLKNFPGPRMAAFTEMYAFYYEIWQNGLMVQHIKELHRVYGPVVRIRPNELHFSSAEAFFKIYASHSGFTKDPAFYDTIDASEASVGIINPEKHKVRRDLLNPLFSRRAIIKFEQKIQDTIELFLERLREYADEPINIRFAFRSLTMDVITAYSYGHSFGGISAPGFDHPITASLDGAIMAMAASRYFPALRLLQKLPPGLFTKLDARLSGYVYMRNVLSTNVDAHLADPEAFRKAEHETIYHRLLPESVHPSQWPSKNSLIGEAQVLFSAGTDTTGNALTFGLYYLLLEENKDKLRRLEDELINAWPEKDSPFSYEQAEKLPYLTAVIKESLRISIGVPVPLSRIVETPTVIDGVHVPAGAIVSVSISFVVMNPDVYPQPETFLPERWLQPNVAELDKHLVVFSRGPRSCLGINLAWCEIYLTFSHFLRKFEVGMYDTSPEDMEVREYIFRSWCGKGMHVVLKERPT